MPRPTIEIQRDLTKPHVKREVQAMLAPLQGEYEIELKPVDPRRGNQANRYYWKCVVEPFKTYMHTQGELLTKLQCHELVTLAVVPIDVPNPVTGEVMRIGKSTHNMSIPEFAEFIDAACAWLAEMGIVVPPPQSIFDTTNTRQFAAERKR